MSNQPGQRVALRFARDEWELLVTLPRRVLLAAGPADPAQVAQGLAALAAIASGHGAPSALVREVAGAIFAEQADTVPAFDDLDGRADGAGQTITACRQAARLIEARAGSAERIAYRDWLREIAAAANRSAAAQATPGGVRFGPSSAQDRFLAELAAAFQG